MSAVPLDLTPKGSVEIETLVNGPIQTNSYAVISDNECVIIDPAWEGERLVEHIRAEHPGVRVLGAVCTHGHADHVGGVAADGMLPSPRKSTGCRTPRFFFLEDNRHCHGSSPAHWII